MPAAHDVLLSLAVLREGKEADLIPFDGDLVTFGRDAANDVSLPDASVSRRHAELSRRGARLVLKDLGSRNGVWVNGVPRAQANLQIGDLFKIGIYQFRLHAGAAKAPKPGARRELSNQTELEQTLSRRVPLPELRQERQLATVYHACFWLTECTNQEQLIERVSALLHDSLHAVETQYYSADLRLKHRVGKGRKAAVKLANFLATKFQSAAEAMIIEGAHIAVHQRGVNGFNYLVGPIRRAGSGEMPADFLVLMRSVDWEGFTVEDRVLVQAVCQFWARETEKIVSTEALRSENKVLKTAKPTLMGTSAELGKLRASLGKAAVTKATILLEGETGSGKEVVAQFVHENSPRAGKPFIKVNCAAIPDGLIESELFGHIKGAFTDAKDSRKGKFTQANGGTIFLDEIGEMPLQVQAKVLRVLENSEIEPLGSESVQKVDVRVIVATHRNLEEMVARKEFRQDLFFRLNVFRLRVPPLREHADDIAELACHFLDQFCRENGLAELAMESSALKHLARHPWPGNVRELRNIIHRCAIVATGVSVTLGDVEEVLGK